MSKYLLFGTVSLALLLSSIGASSVAVAFPIMTSSLKAPLVLAAWVIAIYQLAMTVTLPLAGRINDRMGRKNAFLLFLSLFVAGSLFSAIAPNMPLLILSRLIQGIGGGGFLPSASAIVADRFPRTRQRSIGLFSSIVPIGSIIGPNVGGWLVTAYGWTSVFWMNVPLGIFIFVAAAVLLRNDEKEKAATVRMDLAGVGLFAGSLSAIMIGISQVGVGQSFTSWLAGGTLLIVGAIFVFAFVRREAKVESPVIDVRVLRDRPFQAANIYNFIFGSCSLGIMSFVPLYAVTTYGMTTMESGLVLTPRSLGIIAASIVTSLLLVKIGYRRPMIAGVIVMSLGLLLLGIESRGVSFGSVHIGSMTSLLVVMLILGIGIGIASPASNNACIELMPHKTAAIVGIRGMFRQTGGAFSVGAVSLIVHHWGNEAGFRIAFWGLAALLLLSITLVFSMPKGCSSGP